MRFTDEHVLAAVQQAGKPLTTRQVAQACRRAAGMPERVAESPEVRSALDRLAAAGQVVTATRRDDQPADDTFIAIVPADDRRSRFWATPEQAAAAKKAAAAADAAYESADEAHVRFKLAWRDAGGPAYNAATAEYPWPKVFVHHSADADGGIMFAIHASARQLDWLLATLQAQSVVDNDR